MVSKTQLNLMVAALFTIGSLQAQSFSGNFSSEGDVTAKGTMTMNLTQTKAKIEGTTNYKSYSGDFDSGVLSVNGYAKDGIGFIRLRDQRGNALADGEIHFKGAQTLHFTQTSANNNGIPRSVYLYNTNTATRPARVAVPKGGALAGSFSNEGDTTASGIMSMDLQQHGAKLEGTANYTNRDGSIATGVISVNGYAKGDTGYLRFRDSNGNTLGDGTLKNSGGNYIFTQTTNSQWLPKSAFLHK